MILRRRKMVTRIVVGFIAAAVLIALVLLGKWYTVALVTAAAFLCVYEIYSTLKSKGIRVLWPFLLGYCLLFVPAYYFFGQFGIIGLLFLCALGIMTIAVLDAKVGMPDVFASLASLIYPFLPLTFVLMAALIDNTVLRRLIIFQTCVCTYLSDTFALFGGMLFGKKKLCERLSPKKTMEGFYSGIIGSLIGGVVLYLIESSLAWYHYLIIAVLCSLLGVVGDLFASAIKRFAGVKDYGNLLPGHGGVMDRIDSLLFTLPVVCIYYMIFIV